MAQLIIYKNIPATYTVYINGYLAEFNYTYIIYNRSIKFLNEGGYDYTNIVEKRTLYLHIEQQLTYI